MCEIRVTFYFLETAITLCIVLSHLKLTEIYKYIRVYVHSYKYIPELYDVNR